MFIEQPARLLRLIFPRAYWRMDKHDHSVYLTFDDGPIPEATPFILDTLKEFGVKATFFVVGDNVRKHPELFERIRQEGHQVGNHTYNHWGPSFRHTIGAYSRNVKKCEDLINSLIPKGERAGERGLFRPPHGWMRPAAYIWLKYTYRIVMWDVVTRDYSNKLTAADVVNNVKNLTRNGSIITFHDSLKSIDKLKTALPESLQWLKDQGYAFKILQS